MRAVFLAFVLFVAGCSRTPDQQQSDDLRHEAKDQGAAVENAADAEVNRMEQRAATLRKRAKTAREDTGKEIEFQAGALIKEAKKVRKQAYQQAFAIKESTDARIKAFESR